MQRLQLRRTGRSLDERTRAERSHDDHGYTELGRERQQLFFDVPLVRVVRQLHGVEAAGPER